MIAQLQEQINQLKSQLREQKGFHDKSHDGLGTCHYCKYKYKCEVKFSGDYSTCNEYSQMALDFAHTNYLFGKFTQLKLDADENVTRALEIANYRESDDTSKQCYACGNKSVCAFYEQTIADTFTCNFFLDDDSNDYLDE